VKSSICLQSVAVAVSAVLCSAGAGAQSLRCNGDLASVGHPKATVYRICGAPVAMQTYCRPALTIIQPSQYPGGPATVITPPCEQVEEWTYNPGSGQFWTTFRFENGQAVAIVYGDRIP
jgi:hypothetical protein